MEGGTVIIMDIIWKDTWRTLKQNNNIYIYLPKNAFYQLNKRCLGPVYFVLDFLPHFLAVPFLSKLTPIWKSD